MAIFTMMNSLAALLLFLISSSSLIAASDSPFILAHKKATLNRLKSGAEKLSVSIDIYNQGSATAYDVSLNDDGWSSDIFSIISGNTSTSWERLDAGALLSHSFELESNVKTVFYSSPAVITFRVPTKAALQAYSPLLLQEAYSTPLLPLEILSDKPRESTLDLRALAKYGSLISVISIVVLFVYLVATPSKSGAAKGSKKKR
ncbi:Translocon-associated protein subunit beta [Cynara cardunculus var. scolymus]|uniref:Translocon-associated protein subunit beta n=1 Tax=Cynara cardunculus var. scolymus TaxID=59895 RepID=A0A103Y4K5_CYNCS|nr:Translocon-associated protein subunit beta [Cynara cardunculus var. scolymus]